MPGGWMRTNSRSWKGARGMLAMLAIASIAVAAEPDRRLVNAAADQDYSTLRALLKQRAGVTAARPDGSTALLWAVHWNNLEIADLLLREGANVNAADDHGVTPLHQAAENASAAMADKLLKADANPNAAEMSGFT